MDKMTCLGPAQSWDFDILYWSALQDSHLWPLSCKPMKVPLVSWLPAPVLTFSSDFSSVFITPISDSAFSCYMFRPLPIYPKQVPLLFIVSIIYEKIYNKTALIIFIELLLLQGELSYRSTSFYHFHSFSLTAFLYYRKMSQHPIFFKSQQKSCLSVDCCANVPIFLKENKKERRIKETKDKWK